MVEISLVEWSNLNSSLSQQQQPATITWVYCEQYIPCLDWFTPRSVKRVDQKTPDATRHAFYWAWIAGGTNTPSKTSTSRLKICSTLPSVDQYDSEFFASWFKQVGFVERYNFTTFTHSTYKNRMSKRQEGRGRWSGTGRKRQTYLSTKTQCYVLGKITTRSRDIGLSHPRVNVW